MKAFLHEYRGICNFNYKVREHGDSLCIFEVNTRVGADLACDVPRSRARCLFEKLEELCSPTVCQPQGLQTVGGSQRVLAARTPSLSPQQGGRWTSPPTWPLLSPPA